MLLIKNSPTTKEKSFQLQAYRLSATPAHVRQFKDEVGLCASIQPPRRKPKPCTEQVTLRPLQNPPPLTNHVQSPSTFDCTCQRYTIMIRLRSLRTLPFSFCPLRSVNNGRVAIHRSPLFGSSQIRRFSSTQIRRYSLLNAKPSDNPELFDVLLTDVNHRVLHGGVSEKLVFLNHQSK
jgi:hypothetical protein